MLEEFDNGECLPRRTVLAGKVERSAARQVNAVSLGAGDDSVGINTSNIGSKKLVIIMQAHVTYDCSEYAS